MPSQVLKQSDCADTVSFEAEFSHRLSKVKPKHLAASIFGFLRLRTAIFRSLRNSLAFGLGMSGPHYC